MAKHKKNQKAKKIKRERRRIRMEREWDRTIRKERKIALREKNDMEERETEEAIKKFNALKEKAGTQNWDKLETVNARKEDGEQINFNSSAKALDNCYIIKESKVGEIKE